MKVRFPPSPTGYCHVGTARMAVINYLFAKRNGGAIVFRSEDTDRERSTKEFEEDIVEQLHWLGLSWDEFTRSSERVSRHTEAMQSLVESGKAYISKEKSAKDETVEVEVVRLRNSGTSVTFTDVVRGDITFDTTELGDFVIGRAINDPLYHLAVVVDDADGGVTHVIRGEDHISNTPRQILIQEALGFPRPVYAHYPLLLGADRSKLSKRTGDVAVRSYREQGYMPQALLNYIAVLGWTPPSGKELLSLEDMVQEFALEDLHSSGAVFDIEKLRWFNKEYLHATHSATQDSQIFDRLRKGLVDRGISWSDDIGHKLVPLVKERISVYADIDEDIAAYEYDFFFSEPERDTALIPEKKSDKAAAAKHLAAVVETWAKESSESFNDAERLKSTVWDYATNEGRGAVLWPVRYALSGREKSPDPFFIASVLGKDTTLARLRSAIAQLGV